MRFEDFLTKVMSILGLSQRSLGKVIDMSNQSVSFYVNGKQDVPSTTKVAIVYHLNREIDRRIIEHRMRIETIQRDIVELEALKEEAGGYL